MTLIRGCLLAVVVFGCLANAQTLTKPQKPYEPEPPRPYPQRPQTQYPQPPRPQPPKPQPQLPQPPRPQPQKPQPQYPQPPRPQPQKPQPQYPQPPRPQPQKPQPQHPQPQRPQPKDPKKTPGKPGDEVWPPDFHTCDVEPNARIPCGPSGITEGECQSINCCFDGRTCYYGKHVTLQCTKEGFMIVVISRDATLPNIDTESIYFYESGEGCQAVDTTSSFLIYMFPVTACGTVQWDEPGAVVYENRMYSSYETTIGDRGIITRDTNFDLLVQCRYVGSSVEALVIEVNPVPPPLPAAALGPLEVALYLGNGQCTMKGCIEDDVAFTSYYADVDYPVVKVLRDPVYVDVVMLGKTDPNLVLTLGRCWVTADPYPHSYPQWDLIINGCPNSDDKYMTRLLDTSTLPIPTHHRRFVFKMFTFMTQGNSDPSQKMQSDSPPLLPSKQLMYIHCTTSLCAQMPGSQCEPRCFRKRRDIAASAVTKTRPESTTVTSKPIQIVSA